MWQGTVVRWDGVKDFPQHGGGGQTDRYLQRTINKLGLHLGLYLHRFLSKDDFNITIAVEDVRTGTVYLDFGVEPLDPFGYPVSGNHEYPRKFTATVPAAGDVVLNAHIWTPKSNVDEYKAVRFRHRSTRLLLLPKQPAGPGRRLDNFRQPEQHLALARVSVNLPEASRDVFRLTVKKSGVETSPDFTTALEKATDPKGNSFLQYLNDADSVYRDSRKRSSTARKAVAPPGKGISPTVRETLTEEVPMIPTSIRFQSAGRRSTTNYSSRSIARTAQSSSTSTTDPRS